MKHPWPSVTKEDKISPLAVIPSGARNLQDFSLRSKWQLQVKNGDMWQMASGEVNVTRHPSPATRHLSLIICKLSVNTSYTCHSRMFLAGIQACADGRWIPDKSIREWQTCPHGSGEWAVHNVFTEYLPLYLDAVCCTTHLSIIVGKPPVPAVIYWISKTAREQS